MVNADLQEEKNRFEALFQFASMGILVADAKAEIVLANNFLLRLFGYDNSDELRGKSIENLIPKRFHTNHVHQRNHYIENPHPRPMGAGKDLFAVRKDGTEFPVEISLSNFKTGLDSYTIAFIIDITLRKESEKSILLQKEQLTDINKKVEELNDELEAKVELRTKQLQEILKELEVSR